MPMVYYKCDDCGREHREIVEIDKTGYTKLPNGRYRFNPNAPKEPEVARGMVCTCGKGLLAEPDPKAVKSFVQFNFLAD